MTAELSKDGFARLESGDQVILTHESLPRHRVLMFPDSENEGMHIAEIEGQRPDSGEWIMLERIGGPSDSAEDAARSLLESGSYRDLILASCGYACGSIAIECERLGIDSEVGARIERRFATAVYTIREIWMSDDSMGIHPIIEATEQAAYDELTDSGLSSKEASRLSSEIESHMSCVIADDDNPPSLLEWLGNVGDFRMDEDDSTPISKEVN